jgi:hypothetical protein
MMTLREERNEPNKRAWRAHLEQERLDLSASVEAALVNDGAQAQDWQDELDEQDDVSPITGGTSIVPPRITLQSRMLPAVQPQQYGMVTTTSQQAISSSPSEEEEADPRSVGMLARLARRFTASFSAVHPAIKSEALQPSAPLLAPERSLVQDTGTYQPLAEYGQSSYMPADYADAPLVRVIDTTPAAPPVVDAVASQPKKRRSLKRNAKVRLETTEQPAIAKATLVSRIEEQETGATLLATDVQDAVSRNQMSSNLSALSAPKATSSHVPIVTMPSFPSGSGVFESEQSDVMIVCSAITAASVVLVTLTSNPGPVVVQYISLQPEVGFTVHLTAPVTMRTTFNYVVL